MWCIYAMEYYSALKKNEILIYTSMTWMNLENINLSKIRQTQKDEYYMIPLILGTYSSQIHGENK